MVSFHFAPGGFIFTLGGLIPWVSLHPGCEYWVRVYTLGVKTNYFYMMMGEHLLSVIGIGELLMFRGNGGMARRRG